MTHNDAGRTVDAGVDRRKARESTPYQLPAYVNDWDVYFARLDDAAEQARLGVMVAELAMAKRPPGATGAEDV